MKYRLSVVGFVVGVVFYVKLLSAQESLPRVEIRGSELRTITSSIVEGQEYNLFINLPRDYQDSTKRFPVVYLLDAQ